MSKIIHITRRERFSAAHKLSRDDWHQDKNDDVFGKCANPYWHGHNYDLYVTVKGEIDPKTGFVVDLRELSDLIKEKVIQHVDHKNINLQTPWMAGKMASTENIAIGVWEQLADSILAMGAELHCIRLEETENNYVEYYG